MIQAKLQAIKKLTGLDLTLCDYFTGVNESNGSKYFNIILEERVSESLIYTKLLGVINTGIISRVEPNGLKRLAIYF